MSDIIVIKNSGVKGRIPPVEQLQFGELAINTHDGLLFAKKSDKIKQELITFNSNVTPQYAIEEPENTHNIVLDVFNKPVKRIEINEHTSIKFSNPPKDGNMIRITVFLKNCGDFSVKWDNNIQWENGIAPAIKNNAWSIIEFFCLSDFSEIFGVCLATNVRN